MKDQEALADDDFPVRDVRRQTNRNAWRSQRINLPLHDSPGRLFPPLQRRDGYDGTLHQSTSDFHLEGIVR